MKLIGTARLGRDAEVRDVGGAKVANLSLAFNYGKKDEDGKKPTQWVDAALWGKQAEALEQYLVKGTVVDVVLRDVHVESKDGKAYLKGTVIDFGFTPKQRDSEAQKEAPKPAPKPAPSAGGSSGFSDFESDIPFASCAIEDDVIVRRLGRRGRMVA